MEGLVLRLSSRLKPPKHQPIKFNITEYLATDYDKAEVSNTSDMEAAQAVVSMQTESILPISAVIT